MKKHLDYRNFKDDSLPEPPKWFRITRDCLEAVIAIPVNYLLIWLPLTLNGWYENWCRRNSLLDRKHQMVKYLLYFVIAAVVLYACIKLFWGLLIWAFYGVLALMVANYVYNRVKASQKE